MPYGFLFEYSIKSVRLYKLKLLSAIITFQSQPMLKNMLCLENISTDVNADSFNEVTVKTSTQEPKI